MSILLLISFIIIAIISIYIRLNRANIIGSVGERKVSLRLHLLPTEYYLLDDVYLKVNDNHVQIDHIVVSKYGIFVIETKNYKGLIFGNDKSEYWTKNMYGNKYHFRNPLKQNYYHVKSLQTLLGIPQYKFIPIVVFLDKAKLRCSTSGIVIHANDLVKTIKRHNNVMFDENELKRIVKVISESSITDRRRRKTHVHQVKQNVAQKERLVQSGICPRCGKPLVKRKGEYGRFLGCSNYPNCKFTKSL